MLHLLKRPEETPKKDNAFKDIRNLPWWQAWLEMVGYVAALLVIAEFIWRLFV